MTDQDTPTNATPDAGSSAASPPKRRKILGLGFYGLLAMLAGMAGGWLYTALILNRPAIFTADQTIMIKPGAGRVVISAVLNRAGIDHPLWVMRLEELRRGKSYVPKAGEFALPQGTSLTAAMDIIHQGQSILHQLTIPEGQSSAEVTAAINADDRLRGAITPQPREGTLLPETYAFIRDASRDQLIQRMQEAQEISFASLWGARAKDLPFETLDEAIILASIVEKETGLSGERGKVASVFINRLRAGMRLQSDPTVLYGLKQAGVEVKTLLRRHWKHNSPWNTYRVDGLPPTPICNPGEAAMQAVLNPDATGYYYFVANGEGGHNFAKTLADHNRNVRLYQQKKKSMN